jgi:hypothetical protein
MTEAAQGVQSAQDNYRGQSNHIDQPLSARNTKKITQPIRELMTRPPPAPTNVSQFHQQDRKEQKNSGGHMRENAYH